MDFYSFLWGADKIYARSETGERKTIDKPLPIFVGVVAGSKRETAEALFSKYVGKWVSKSPSDQDFTSISEHVVSRAETGGQRKLQKVIEKAMDDLGSIAVESIVAWHTAHDNNKDEHIPVVKLRITAREGDKVRVLNVRGDDDSGVIIDDPMTLAEDVTDLF